MRFILEMYFKTYKCVHIHTHTHQCAKINFRSVLNLLQLAFAVVCAAFFAIASARPRFIAIPLDDVQFVEVADFSAPLIRVARQTGFQSRDAEIDAEESARVQRGAHGGDHGHDYVDYGAHTGHHGAFGWYADFPVIKGH